MKVNHSLKPTTFTGAALQHSAGSRSHHAEHFGGGLNRPLAA